MRSFSTFKIPIANEKMTFVHCALVKYLTKLSSSMTSPGHKQQEELVGVIGGAGEPYVDHQTLSMKNGMSLMCTAHSDQSMKFHYVHGWSVRHGLAVFPIGYK